MSELRRFFKNTEVHIGKDFQAETPFYFDSLRNAFSHYFSTYQDQKEIIHLIIDSANWDQEKFSSARLHHNISHAILAFHRFFELYIKEVLRSVNPYLAVKFLEREEELFLFLDQKLPPEQIKTVEFAESMKRLKYAFKYFDNSTETYRKVLNPVSFLNDKEAVDSLEMLAEWRNRIMHNGATYPGFFAFEYLITQRLISLVVKIIDSKDHKDKFIPHYFVTPSGFDLVRSLQAIRFHYKDFANEEKKKDLRSIFFYIAHLKEMGRSNLTQDFYRIKNKDYRELQYDNPIGRTERFAEAEKNHPEFHQLNKCNCCKAKSQVVYRKHFKDFFTQQQDFVSWLRCFNCDYSINERIGDPYSFGLADHLVF